MHIINQFKNISAFIYDTLCTKNYLFDNNEKYMNEILELFFKSNQNEPINLEELLNLEAEIKKYKNINENSGSGNKIKKKIKSKINKFIYKQRYEKQQNNNMSQLRLNSLIKQQDLQRFSSKVSGRNLSTHVDNVNPEKKVVSVTYNAFNNSSVQPNIIPGNNLNLQNSNSGLAPPIQTGNGQIIIGDNNMNNNMNNNLQNLPNQNDTNQINNQINLVGNQNDVRQFDKNITQQQPNQNIKNINPINNITNLNNNAAPINNNLINSVSNIQNTSGNNSMYNLSTPNNIQKNPISINSLLSNIKSPTNNNQSSQLLMMNSPQINLPDRAKGININPLSPNISNPNIQNIANNINPLNFNNPNLIPQNVQGINATKQNIIPGLQQNNNNLPVMNYLNPIPNPLMNIPNIGQIIPGGQNYPNIPGQINNMGMNQINNGLNNNINNNQFQGQFNPNIIPPITQSASQPPIINKMEINGNMNNNNNHNHNSRSQQTNKNNLIDTLKGILQNINSGTSSSSKDPRKRKK